MEIGSATSNLATITAQAAQARARQVEQEQAAAPPPSAPTENTEAAAAAEERNRPVVNTSGQLVGTRINTTA